LPWAVPNPLKVADGKMQVSTAPGLGVDLDPGFLEAHRYKGETGWA
jgi:galactonate dehydratase